MLYRIKRILAVIGIAIAAIIGALMAIIGYIFLLLISLLPFILKIGIIGVVLYFIARWIGVI